MNRSSIDFSDWDLDGKELCALTHEDFKIKVRTDPGDLFWTHLELLRKCKFVAVQQSSPASSLTSATSKTTTPSPASLSIDAARKTMKKPPIRLGSAKFTVMSEAAAGSRSGNNGQIQLWQFL